MTGGSLPTRVTGASAAAARPAPGAAGWRARVPQASSSSAGGPKGLAGPSQALVALAALSAAASTAAEQLAVPAFVEEDEEALLYYSAWASIGKLMITIKRRIFGESVASIVAESSAASSSKKKNAQAGPPMTRTPSGAELNAWIGLAAQNGACALLFFFHSETNLFNLVTSSIDSMKI